MSHSIKYAKINAIKYCLDYKLYPLNSKQKFIFENILAQPSSRKISLKLVTYKIIAYYHSLAR